jgi:hypothetical protein
MPTTVNKFISKVIKSSSSDGDFLTIGDVVTPQDFWQGFQSCTRAIQLNNFADEGNIANFNTDVFPRQSGITIDGVMVDDKSKGNGVYELFSLGNTWSWQKTQINGNISTTNLPEGSQMLGFGDGYRDGFRDSKYLLLQGWKMFFSDYINLGESGVDWADPTTYAGIPIYLGTNGNLTVTPSSTSGDTIRSVGFILKAFFNNVSGNYDKVLIFFDPDGFYAKI